MCDRLRFFADALLNRKPSALLPQEIGHRPDDRLCTTLIRLCSSHGAAAQALGLYDWMRSSSTAGGAGLKPTVFTYTAAMRAALNGNLPERAMQVMLASASPL